MSYESTLAYIHGVQWRGQKPGLDRIRTLLNHLGHPEERLKFVHIGGTNGKGSTAALMESVLRKAGYRTGLYTSPFINRFNERIRVDGQEITTYEELVNAKNERSAGDQMTLDVWRNGETLTITVTLDEEVPTNDTTSDSSTDNSQPQDGQDYGSQDYNNMSPEDFFNYFFGQGGNGQGGW